MGTCEAGIEGERCCGETCDEGHENDEGSLQIAERSASDRDGTHVAKRAGGTERRRGPWNHDDGYVAG